MRLARFFNSFKAVAYTPPFSQPSTSQRLPPPWAEQKPPPRSFFSHDSRPHFLPAPTASPKGRECLQSSIRRSTRMLAADVAPPL